ncbi:hypothetical protein E7T06_07145 [Deinococcus sp. Arct2-2]|uniref:hypothetical protein n=1 Tax=Deinococcus sp. Arct2-2 TaxID=2568653 RepID=UPI0010A3C58D|nr:hypothetical protein [Deinococcus sp. Arct2-2]THF70474.1 hypothetical protein E7T06_07145 [Deinococcus sp. Arct2-2]
MPTKSYGIYSTTPRTIAIKDDRDNGWVADVKWAFASGARPERKFELADVPTLKGAAAEGGQIKLEVTPRLDGEHLPSVYLPVTLRGNITIDDDGAVTCTTRVAFDALENAGLSVDTILNSSNCLECRVSDQPTLEESIQSELKAEQQVKEDVADVLKDTKALFDQPEPAAPNIPLGPDLDVEEDMPFPTDGGDGFGTQPSA